MDKNHLEESVSKLRATEDIRWVLNKRSNLLVPQRTGFEDKTRWDRLLFWAQVIGAIAIPLLIIGLIVGVWQFNIQQQTDRAKTLEQQQHDRENFIDQQQQTTLETYLDRMSDLLFTQHLDISKPGEEVGQVARARTLTALHVLDPARKGILLQFLYESHLIGYFDLTHASMHGPIIDLSEAHLSGANLNNAFLNGANLNGADLSGADLNNAIATQAQLNKAKSLQGTIMPNGSKHP